MPHISPPICSIRRARARVTANDFGLIASTLSAVDPDVILRTLSNTAERWLDNQLDNPFRAVRLAEHCHSTMNKFSIAMCTFNGGSYVKQQLESIAAQTRAPDELVVCDDCSTDETIQILEEFSRSALFPVGIFVNEQTLGSTKNFERAASLCQGDLIAFSDQDDVWMPEKLALLEAEFLNHPDVGLVFSDAELVDEELRPLGSLMWNEVGFREREKNLVKKGRALDVFLPGWSVTGATMAFRSRFVEVILPIPTDLPMIHDGWIQTRRLALDL